MSTARVENPEEIVCTLKFTMKLKDWMQIRKTLGSNEAYVELKMINEIRDLVFQLEQTLYAKPDQ